MNDEIEPILVGDTDDIEIGSVENFEYEDNNFAIFTLESRFFSHKEIVIVKKELL